MTTFCRGELQKTARTAGLLVTASCFTPVAIACMSAPIRHWGSGCWQPGCVHMQSTQLLWAVARRHSRSHVDGEAMYWQGRICTRCHSKTQLSCTWASLPIFKSRLKSYLYSKSFSWGTRLGSGIDHWVSGGLSDHCSHWLLRITLISVPVPCLMSLSYAAIALFSRGFPLFAHRHLFTPPISSVLLLF